MGSLRGSGGLGQPGSLWALADGTGEVMGLSSWWVLPAVGSGAVAVCQGASGIHPFELGGCLLGRSIFEWVGPGPGWR